MLEAEARALRDRIIDELEGMDEIPHPRFTYRNDPDLKVDDSSLMIRPGWQKACDEWDRHWLEIEAEERQNRVMSVGEGNMLMAHGRPVISAENNDFDA